MSLGARASKARLQSKIFDMVTTFDAARWAVRAILIASIVSAVLGLGTMVFLLALPSVPGLPGVPNSKYFVVSLFSSVPALVIYGALYLFSDSIARVVAGGAESVRHPLSETRQFYPLTLSLIGFVVLLPALTTLLSISVGVGWTLIESSFDWSSLSLASTTPGKALVAQSFLTRFADALLRLFVGLLLLSWRRLAPLGARPDLG